MGSFFVVQGSQMNRWLFGGVFKVPPCRRSALPCPTSCAIVMGTTHCMQQSQGAIPGSAYHGSQGANGRTGRLQPPRWNHRQHIRCMYHSLAVMGLPVAAKTRSWQCNAAPPVPQHMGRVCLSSCSARSRAKPFRSPGDLACALRRHMQGW